MRREEQVFECEECLSEFYGKSYIVITIDDRRNRMCYECKEYHLHNADQILIEDWWSVPFSSL